MTRSIPRSPSSPTLRAAERDEPGAPTPGQPAPVRRHALGTLPNTPLRSAAGGTPPRLPAVRPDTSDWFSGIPHIDRTAVTRAALTLPPAAPRAAPAAATPPPPEPALFLAPEPDRQPGQAFDRGKAGFTVVEANGYRPLAPALNAGGAGQSGIAAAQFGIGSTAAGLAHEVLGAGLNGHAAAASWQKHRRYDRHLNAMLNADVDAFRNAAGSRAKPRLDTLILTRDRKGAFRYDLAKVMKLAASDDPALANESAHAKDVLLTLYVRDEVAGKRMNRAAYELGRNVLGIASGAALIAGTHGLAIAPGAAGAIAAKQAGFALGVVNALDVGKGVRGLKQRLRNDKAREIDSNERSARMRLDPATIPADAPEEAVAGVHAVLRDNGRIEADRKLFGKLFPGRLINEEKSSSNKNRMADQTVEHALRIIDRSVDRFAGDGQEKLHAFHAAIHVKDASMSRKKRALRDAIDRDPDLGSAYRLMRDLGMRRGEARYAIESLIARRIEIGLANDPQAAHARATESGRKHAARAAAGERSPDDIASMRGVLQRR
ncbi:hypothetical protein [Burkholderia alba]|uniref:hypothetical protein n=1 Tax=Burkholderia alba TaxID=2683677 RepID=UPI002B061F3C|nr:hypothetical protein [Burkholderia alba]